MFIASALMCLSLNIYFEAAGEPYAGRMAVARVTMNRAVTTANVCDTVMAKGQFSWTSKMVAGRSADGGIVLRGTGQQIDQSALADSYEVAVKAIKDHSFNRSDISMGATYYHAKGVSPYWSKHAEVTAVIGSHIFYKLKGKSVMTYKA